MSLYARKFTAEEGVTAGFVDGVIKEGVMEKIHEIGVQKAAFAGNRMNFKKLKEEMNKVEIDCCMNKQHAVGVKGEIPNSESPFSKL